MFVVVDGSPDADGVSMRVLQGSSADRSQWREPTRTAEGLCSLYEAALCLFEEVRIKPRNLTDLRSVFLLVWLISAVWAALQNQNILIDHLQSLSGATMAGCRVTANDSGSFVTL